MNLDHITPYEHQSNFVHDARNRWMDYTTALEEAGNRYKIFDKPGERDTILADNRWLYAAPTGSGKSICELLLLQLIPESFLITPRIEIIRGMLEKANYGKVDSLNKLIDYAMKERITTPLRMVNLLAKGEFPYSPKLLIIDESHHETADTYKLIDAYLPNLVKVGLTATPYRGTPKSTKEFYERWNNQVTWILRVKEAVEKGIISLPKIIIWPLCDDDEIEIANGEFITRNAGEMGISRSADLINRIREANWYNYTISCRDIEYYEENGQRYAKLPPFDWREPQKEYDKSTIIAVSTTEQLYDLVERLNNAGLPAAGVTQSTSYSEREYIFKECVERRIILVQIDVVSEGVDLPIQRLIDVKPTMSPVRWKQQVGRIERPGGDREYIVTNRNLERFCYLYEGMVPAGYVAESQKVFNGQPTQRTAARAMGLEDLGRFAPAEIVFRDGCKGLMYSLYAVERKDEASYTKIEYAALVHPCYDPIFATRTTVNDNGSPVYGHWQSIDSLPDVKGFGSTPPQAISDRQKAKWVQLAAYHGLDPSVTPNRKNIQALFLLLNLRKRIC